MQKNIWIAAKYLRLSIEDGDKAESESIVNQSILIDNYMKSTSDITIVETFKDDGFSGTDFKRPGFQAMLKAIENKEINCIIVKDGCVIIEPTQKGLENQGFVAGSICF